MLGRERVRRTFSFEKPDRIPLKYFWVDLPKERADLWDLLNEFTNDFGSAWTAIDPNQSGIGQDGAVDLFGCKWCNAGHGPLSVGHPLQDWGALKHFRAPDPREYVKITPDEEMLKKRDEFYCAPWSGNLFERIISLRGYENAMMDFVEEPPELDLLIAMLTEHNERYMRLWMQYDLDGIGFSDDSGSTTGTLISPESWRRHLKPAYQYLYGIAHEHGLDVHLHSDGKVGEIIGDFIEIGLTAINQQSYLCGTEELARRYGGKITFEPDPGRQDLLPFGAPKEIEAEVKRWVDGYWTGEGGLVLASFPMIGPVPLENVEALLRAEAREVALSVR